MNIRGYVVSVEFQKYLKYIYYLGLDPKCPNTVIYDINARTTNFLIERIRFYLQENDFLDFVYFWN